MKRLKKWFNIAVPAGWEDILVRTVKVAVVAFVVFHLKELVDAGRADTLDIALDSAWLAGGTVVLNATLMWAKS